MDGSAPAPYPLFFRRKAPARWSRLKNGKWQSCPCVCNELRTVWRGGFNWQHNLEWYSVVRPSERKAKSGEMGGDDLARGAARATFGPPQVTKEKWDAIWAEESDRTFGGQVGPCFAFNAVNIEENETDTEADANIGKPSGRNKVLGIPGRLRSGAISKAPTAREKGRSRR